MLAFIPSHFLCISVIKIFSDFYSNNNPHISKVKSSLLYLQYRYTSYRFFCFCFFKACNNS